MAITNSWLENMHEGSYLQDVSLHIVQLQTQDATNEGTLTS